MCQMALTGSRHQEIRAWNVLSVEDLEAKVIFDMRVAVTRATSIIKRSMGIVRSLQKQSDRFRSLGVQIAGQASKGAFTVRIDSRVGSYVVVIQDGHVLLVRWAEGLIPEWTLPGGGMEFGESGEVCAVRETLEETGFHAVIDRLLGVHDRYIPVKQRLSAGDLPLHLHKVFYQGHVVGGELSTSSDPGNDRAAWVNLADVSELVREQGVDVALALARC